MTAEGRIDLVARLSARLDDMVGDLATIVRAESPSSNLDALAGCAEVIATIGERLVGAPEAVELEGRRHLRWRWGEPRVLLLGHYDTVWPAATIDRWDFSIGEGRATGPGIFDMKAGIVQGLYALAELDERDGIELLLSADEEIGAPSSRSLIEDAARRVAAVLVLEPSADGALKTARKGGGLFRISVTGRAAHAGLEPEKGVNALLEAAHQAIAVAELARPETGTTVTPSLLAAGTASNTVPPAALLQVDVRVATVEEQERMDGAMRELVPVLAGASLEIGGGIDRPPLPASASAELFERAGQVASQLGLPPPRRAEVGGGSDGNFTAAVGTPTLDGLGAVGAGAHAEGEWIDVATMPERAALVAGLAGELLRA